MIRLLFLTFIFTGLSGLSQVGMNQWRIHFSAFNPVGMAQAGTDVYMACENGIVNFDNEDQSINYLTVTNGLSDLGISTVCSNGSIVIIGYQNGNLDILENNVVTNVPWIQLADLQGSKNINNIYFDGDLVYISSGVGLVLYDLSKQEIKDTYYPYTNPLVNDVTVFQDTLYVATEQGIYYAHKDAPFLNDQAQWSKLTSIPANVQNERISDLETFDNKLVFVYDNTDEFQADSIYYISGGTVSQYSGNPVEMKRMSQGDSRLILSLSTSVRILDETMTQVEIVFSYPGMDTPNPMDCIIYDGYYWIADQNNGMMKAVNSWSSQSLFNNSPFTDGSYRMDIQYGKVLVAGGGITHNLLNIFALNGVYTFEDEVWTNYTHRTRDEITDAEDWDFLGVAINQNNTNEFAFSGFNKGGIKVVKDGAITDTFNLSNSPLEEIINGNMAIPDLQYDLQGNLWALNQGIEPLKCFAADGAQYSFSLGSGAKNKFPYRMMIDRDGIKWAAVTNVGLVAFDDGGTLDDPSDDQWQTLSSAEGSGNLPSLLVKAIAQDIDGEIWIGTEEGLVVLYSTANLFDGGFGDYDASPILLEVDGEVEKLLGSTFITSIAVDFGNRKWIGTSSSGVFCLSPDGLTEVYRFTTDNSPLISNNVLDIRVDHASGEVYFATDKGLVSFRADATITDDEFSDVKVFPNPVRPDFAGPVTIQGLGYQSDVKITDISGNVVYKTVSNGGSVIWDGKTLQGERVQSGVYLVWSGLTEGKGKEVAKILFIN